MEDLFCIVKDGFNKFNSSFKTSFNTKLLAYFLFMNTLIFGASYNGTVTTNDINGNTVFPKGNNVHIKLADGTITGESEIKEDGTFNISTTGIIHVIKNYSLKSMNLSPNPILSGRNSNLKFEIEKQGLVTVNVYNLLGQHVIKQKSEVLNKGTYNLPINNINLASGIYFCQVMKDGIILGTKKATVIEGNNISPGMQFGNYSRIGDIINTFHEGLFKPIETTKDSLIIKGNLEAEYCIKDTAIALDDFVNGSTLELERIIRNSKINVTKSEGETILEKWKYLTEVIRAEPDDNSNKFKIEQILGETLENTSNDSTILETYIETGSLKQFKLTYTSAFGDSNSTILNITPEYISKTLQFIHTLTVERLGTETDQPHEDLKIKILNTGQIFTTDENGKAYLQLPTGIDDESKLNVTDPNHIEQFAELEFKLKGIDLDYPNEEKLYQTYIEPMPLDFWTSPDTNGVTHSYNSSLDFMFRLTCAIVKDGQSYAKWGEPGEGFKTIIPVYIQNYITYEGTNNELKYKPVIQEKIAILNEQLIEIGGSNNIQFEETTDSLHAEHFGLTFNLTGGSYHTIKEVKLDTETGMYYILNATISLSNSVIGINGEPPESFKRRIDHELNRILDIGGMSTNPNDNTSGLSENNDIREHEIYMRVFLSKFSSGYSEKNKMPYIPNFQMFKEITDEHGSWWDTHPKQKQNNHTITNKHYTKNDKTKQTPNNTLKQ